MKLIRVITLYCLCLAWLSTATASTLQAKIEQVEQTDQNAIEQLVTLQTQSQQQHDIAAFISASEAILSKQLKSAQYSEFEQQVGLIQQHDFWQSSPELKIVVQSALADKAFRQGNTQQASDLQAKVIALAEDNQVLARLSEVYTKQGIYFRNLGSFDKAKGAYLKALNFAEQTGNDLQVARLLVNLGVILESTNQFNSALKNYKDALAIIEKNPDDDLLASCLFNIAATYERLGDLDQALEFALRVLKLDEKLGDLKNQFYSADKVASLYSQVGKTPLSLVYIDKSIAIAERSQNKQMLATAFLKKAKIYEAANQTERAIAVANQSAEIVLENGNAMNVSPILLSLSRIYLKAEQYQMAIDTLDAIPEKNISVVYNRIRHDILSKAHFEMGNYARAYQHKVAHADANKAEYEQKMQAYRDQMDTELAKFTEELKVKDLELENEKQQSDLEVMQYRQYFGITLALIVFLLLSLLIYSQIKKKQMAQAQARLKEAAIDHKNQMLSDICHELRTPFSVLKLQIEALQYNLEPDTEVAHNRLKAKIEQLSHLVSDIDQLSQADSMVLTLNKLKIKATNLLDSIVNDNRVLVEKVGLDLKLDIELDDEVEIDIDVTRIQQVFHNLFSNSIRYTNVPGFIRLKARNDQNTMFIQIDDTSPGVSLEDIEHLFDRLYRVEKSRSRATGGLGLGLSICKSLVELHNGNIVAKQGKSGGLCMQVTLPLN